MKAAAGCSLLVLFATCVLGACDDRREIPTAQPNTTAAIDSALADPRVREIASHFACPCGGCDHEQLLECRCDMPQGAVEAISIIRSRVEADNDVAGAIEYMTTRFPEARRPTPEIDLIRSDPGSRN